MVTSHNIIIVSKNENVFFKFYLKISLMQNPSTKYQKKIININVVKGKILQILHEKLILFKTEN